MEIKNFPIQTQIGIFNNEKELDEYLLNKDNKFRQTDHSAVLYYDYCLINHAPYIYTTDIQEFLKRYSLLKNFNIVSYSNNFDELPAIWVDTISLIESESSKALEEYRRSKSGN